jgi:hypothetical protein
MIEYRKFQLKHPFCERNVKDKMPVWDDDGNPGPTCSGLLPERYALDKSPGFDDTVSAPPSASKALVRAASKSVKKAVRAEAESEDDEPPKKTRKPPSAPAQTQVAGPSNSQRSVARPTNPRPTVIDLSDSDDAGEKVEQGSKLFQKKALPSTDNSIPAARPARIQQAGPSEPRASSNSGQLPNIRDINCVTMEPGSYEIILILDEREKPGLSTKKITSTMSRNNVEWDTRTLSVGDAIWIARDPISKLEVVLDCCLERKRLDDLESSLKGQSLERSNTSG